jgi:hypothetical protein
MKNHMSTSIIQYSHDPLAKVLQVLNEFIERIEHSHQTFKDNLALCTELRKNRKNYERHMKVVLVHFKNLPEKGKVEVELDTYRLINRLNLVAPKAISELEEMNVPFFSWFLAREIKLTVAAFKKGQVKMEQSLYPNNREAILANSDVYQKLEDAWGDLATEEY